MGVHSPAHRRAHLRSPRAPLLRIKPHDPGLDHHPPRPEAACRISLPPTVPNLPSKRGHDLRAPATRVEPARPSSFPADVRSRSRAYPPRIAARLADRDLDLLEERLGARIDTSSAAAGLARSDPEILTVIACHDATIDIGKSRHKSCRALIASNRINAQDSEHTLRAPSLTRLRFIAKGRRAAPAHFAQRHFEAAKTCKIQCADEPLRPKGASERQFALSRRRSISSSGCLHPTEKLQFEAWKRQKFRPDTCRQFPI
jgi:hypothetical protein